MAREAWCAAVHGATRSHTQRSDCTELISRDLENDSEGEDIVALPPS